MVTTGFASALSSAITVNVFPYRVTVPGVKLNLFVVDTYIVINPELLNAFSPIDVTDAGTVIDTKLVEKNAPSPIDVTDAGMIIDSRV